MLRYLGHGERSLGDFPMPPHVRVNWEFLAVIRGKVAPYGHGEDEAELVTDTLWLFPPGFIHGWRGKPGQVCEIVVFHFSTVPSPLERVMGAKGFLALPLGAADKRLVIRLGKLLQPHYRNPTLIGEIHAERALMDLSLILMRAIKECFEPNLAGVSWNKIVDAETWLRRHFNGAPSIEAAAQAVGISASQLRRIFRKVKKKNPKQVLDKLRFDRAMHLMAESDAKLERVAAESGFASASNFCRAFKAHVGKSPTVWRKEIFIQYKRPREADKTAYDHHGRRYREL